MSIVASRLTWVLAIVVGALLAFALLAAGPASSPLPTPTASAFKDKDCKDFDSRRQAQRFFKKHNPNEDPHNLDADNDGKACEDYDY